MKIMPKVGTIMILLAIAFTIIAGIIGSTLGFEMNFSELGPILSVAIMGGMIMAEIRRKKL